ncbi:hypothetical protein ABZ517_23240 [Streptomyces scabiei]|uniref:hypothetical protein n=1 Tax=Streptomyces scabiei TaxID=1930 RepID=UPI0033EBB4AA
MGSHRAAARRCRAGHRLRPGRRRRRPGRARRRRRGRADVDAWLAHALAAHLGHYRDPAAREEAAGLLTPPVLAHAALLAELARLVPGADVDQLAFAGRLATALPEAAGDLAAFLARARWRSIRTARSGTLRCRP